MPHILSDLRYSVRGLTQSPGLTLALLATIALGLGSRVAISGFIRGLGVRAPSLTSERATVSLFVLDRYRAAGPLSIEDYFRLRRRSELFAWIGAARVSLRAVELAGRREVVAVANVTPGLARLWNLSLENGAVVSRRLSQSEFRGRNSVRGSHVRIGAVDTVVNGKAPDGLDGICIDRPVDIWTLLPEASLDRGDRSTRGLWVFAGLRAGVSPDLARRALRGTGSVELDVVPYTGATPEMTEGIRKTEALLDVATALVFFIVCVNVASFLLGRASSRSRPNSVRVALGVSRRRLVQAIVSDSIVISMAGGALAAVGAVWMARVIPALLFEQDAQYAVLVPDFPSVVMACAAGAAVLIVCGFLPILELRHDRPATVLRREAAGPSRASTTVRAGLIIAQMSACCVLVIGTGLLYGGFHAARQTGISRRLGQPLLATVEVHPDVTVDVSYFRNVEHTVRSLRGVSTTAWTVRLPGSQPALQSFRIEPNGLRRRQVNLNAGEFTADMVAQFLWPPKAGRSFTPGDWGCRVAIANEEAAHLLFGDETAGRSMFDSAGAPVEIVGVVRSRKGRGSKASHRPALFYNQSGRSEPDKLSMAQFTAPVHTELERAELNTNVVSSDYFTDVGFAVTAGRLFRETPNSGGCRTAVVNQEAADLYFGRDPVGAAIVDDLGQRTEIVGVVHPGQLGVFDRRAEPTVFFPMAQDCLPVMTLVIGTSGANRPTLQAVRGAVEAVPGRGPAPIVVKTLEDHLVQTALAPLHVSTVLVGTCSATALLLSVLGLYGTLSDTARARRRDLAIRIALGARRRDVIGHVLKEGGTFALIGIATGSIGGLLLSRLLPDLAWRTGPPMFWVWLAGPLVLAAAVAVAGIVPVRRALLIDPLRVLHRD